jgi:hypothetical protein
LSDCLRLHNGSCGKARGDLLVILVAAGRGLRKKTGDNSDELMVLQERIELSTSPLPRMCSEGPKGTEHYHRLQ